MKIDGQIESKLKLLRLTGMLQTLAVRLKQAEESNSDYLEFLMTLLEDEYERRQSGSLLKRLKKAGFEAEKTLEGFDFAFVNAFENKIGIGAHGFSNRSVVFDL